ncbi:MAG: peptidylprolyl isomerase [Candidatus Omnitrophica bacterium]|nr:peptidylprolyl isomerase [Candidatus Omnitrophota bacterium]
MKTIVLIIALFIVLTPNVLSETQLLDRVVAVVNDEIITQSELDVLLRPLYDEYKEQYHNQELIEKLNEARVRLLYQLIEDRLVYQEALKRAIQVDENEIDSQIEEFKKRFPTEMELEQALKREGLTLNEMRDRLRRQLMIRHLQNIEIRAKIVVSPKDIEDYYHSHPSEYSEEEQLKVRSITIKKGAEARVKGMADENAKEKIESLRNKILSGENFGELAKLYSEDTLAKDGGVGGWVGHGDMIPVIDEVIFSLEPSNISQVIETPMGYHLFRVEDRKEGMKRELDDVRDEIFSKLYQEKYDERFTEWMTELKKDAYISIR